MHITYPDTYVSAQVIAENLSEDEIAGLKEMFKMIDSDNSGQITYEELKVGLKKVGANLQESEIYALMKAVSRRINQIQNLI
jgi:calcium-dependent protein kinase